MHSTIQLSRKLLAVALFSGTVLAASASDWPAMQPLEQRVMDQQMETLTIQMQTYRWEVDAAVQNAPVTDERYVRARTLINKGQELIVRLRSAHPTEVPVLRAEYEKVRSELDRVLGRTVAVQ